jgi:hypothetical protein
MGKFKSVLIVTLINEGFFCHELVAAGERLDVVARFAGHKSISRTALYTTLGEKDLAAVEKISWECKKALHFNQYPLSRTFLKKRLGYLKKMISVLNRGHLF